LCFGAQDGKDTPHENLNAVIWMQASAEYRASVLGAYRAAETSLLRALQDPNWTAALEQTGRYQELPPAVILDVDETVLDNSTFMARLVAGGKVFSDAEWSEWVREQRAGLLPGALEFLTVAHANGVALFYVTNRVCDGEDPNDPTRSVLTRHSLPLTGGLLCKESDSASGDKSARRRRVAQTHRILLLIGDDFNDFVTARSEQASVEQRNSLVDAHTRYWGVRWFMIPNPTYGTWDRSVGYSVREKRSRLRVGR
jgi:acid phosphatase